MPPKIAILGWGSLLWEGGSDFDNWHDEWRLDGPTLKIEFSRVSNSRLGALTLVIDPCNGVGTRVAWCVSRRRDVEDAVADLRCREGTTMQNIGVVDLSADEDDSYVGNALRAWGRTVELDFIVYTNLRSNFESEVKSPFTVDAAAAYVARLAPAAKAKAAEYVWRAPDFVVTPVRAALQVEPWFTRAEAAERQADGARAHKSEPGVLTVLGVDLASRGWTDTGTALLSFRVDREVEWEAVRYNVIPWPSEPVSPEAMADLIDSFAIDHNVKAVSLDGPQGWREPDAGSRPGVGRWCEYEARTQGKTGTYGVTYPAPQVSWVRFCIRVFERLMELGHARLVNSPHGCPLQLPPAESYFLMECFPTRTWRSSNLAPLPAKAAANASNVAAWSSTLWQRYGFPTDGPWSGSHDDLQAVVAALVGAAVLGGPCHPIPLGKPGRWIDAAERAPRHWVEGLIWDAAPAASRSGVAVRSPEGPPKGLPFSEPDPTNPILLDERLDDTAAIRRGVRLFEYLVQQANDGYPVGIGYAQFACFIHGVGPFPQLAHRQYLPTDTPHVIALAHQVTDAAVGRRQVSRGAQSLRAGMDTFIWLKEPPYARPRPAFRTTPYSEEQWRAVFPDGYRRLVTPLELEQLQTAD